jgi:hypothetical protein
MSGYKDILVNMRPAPTMGVRVANGKRHESRHIGDAIMKVQGKAIKVKNIRYVPGIKRNLLSIGCSLKIED